MDYGIRLFLKTTVFMGIPVLIITGIGNDDEVKRAF